MLLFWSVAQTIVEPHAVPSGLFWQAWLFAVWQLLQARRTQLPSVHR
jgi:hypothetical protein